MKPSVVQIPEHVCTKFPSDQPCVIEAKHGQ